MAWKAISAKDWIVNSEEAFWSPYRRKRSERAKSQMVRKQFEKLRYHDSLLALGFAAQLANQETESHIVRSQCFLYIAEAAVKHGEIDPALNAAMQCSQLNNLKGVSLLVELVCRYERRDRASEAISILQSITTDSYQLPQRELDLYTAVMMAMADQTPKAIALANQAFDTRAEANKTYRFGRISRSSKYRAIDQAVFSLIRRGGAVRFVGLLSDSAQCTPEKLIHQLQNTIYFNQSQIELCGKDASLDLDSRIIVTLNDFSLDFRWTTDPELIQTIQWRYNRFKYDDQRHIPAPPQDIQKAFIVLAIGDDTSIPDVINPIIELVGVLESFNECIFYERVGPLSRRHIPEFESVTVAQVDKLIRAKLKPLFLNAGFEKCTTRRFVLNHGPLGYTAGVFLKIDKERLDVSAQLQIYYRDLLEDNALKRYCNAQGEFQPKSFLISPHQYLSTFLDWQPIKPSPEKVEKMFEKIVATMETDWLPLIKRTRDPHQEIQWMIDNIEEIKTKRASPSKNRFGATSQLELAEEMARLMGETKLQGKLHSLFKT